MFSLFTASFLLFISNFASPVLIYLQLFQVFFVPQFKVAVGIIEVDLILKLTCAIDATHITGIQNEKHI